MHHADHPDGILGNVTSPSLASDQQEDAGMGALKPDKHQRRPVALLVAEREVLEVEAVGRVVG